jgi:hypothetical protein
MTAAGDFGRNPFPYLCPVNKKYFYIVYLIGALLLLYWVKKNQRGETDKKNVPVEIKAIVPARFDRSVRDLVYSKHARCRMGCRQIDESEVTEILQEGVLNEAKIESSSKGISYPLEGRTHDGQRVRIVFAPQGEKLVVVTVIDLDRDYVCDCE